MTKTILAGSVRRPATGQHKSFAQARTVAKAANIVNGRGYRAVKALDGTSAVIFRPSVASNKQAKVRTSRGL